ncbi:divalent cation tolerance protein [Cupriavidus gilardii J11]|uniref:Divalent cation tolerance protein n=1 Tax=Cupriavidus gilardii J11 TaxID=936133 RepID=A0A562BE76_9BURK|nr:divalent-cation tolerance protein CutA [Cupriavidus gilardii]TWG83456.1 divalent cation tolerance protein [Cupriavidus gilardii J11]
MDPTPTDAATSVVAVMTMLPDEVSARAVTRAVLEARVAACVNRMPPCESEYWWQGRIESAREWPLIIKTTRERYGELERVIRAAHPYDVPEIVALPVVAGLPAYLEWVGTEARGDADGA